MFINIHGKFVLTVASLISTSFTFNRFWWHFFFHVRLRHRTRQAFSFLIFVLNRLWDRHAELWIRKKKCERETRSFFSTSCLWLTIIRRPWNCETNIASVSGTRMCFMFISNWIKTSRRPSCASNIFSINASKLETSCDSSHVTSSSSSEIQVYSFTVWTLIQVSLQLQASRWWTFFN